MTGKYGEPWVRNGMHLYCNNLPVFAPVMYAANGPHPTEAQYNECARRAERARLCVNACKGISDAALEQDVIARLMALVRDAVEDETEFETDWNKEARAVVALLQESPSHE